MFTELSEHVQSVIFIFIMLTTTVCCIKPCWEVHIATISYFHCYSKEQGLFYPCCVTMKIHVHEIIVWSKLFVRKVHVHNKYDIIISLSPSHSHTHTPHTDNGPEEEGLITTENTPYLMQCPVTILKIDLISPGLLDSAVWSWAKGYSGTHYALSQ